MSLPLLHRRYLFPYLPVQHEIDMFLTATLPAAQQQAAPESDFDPSSQEPAGRRKRPAAAAAVAGDGGGAAEAADGSKPAKVARVAPAAGAAGEGPEGGIQLDTQVGVCWLVAPLSYGYGMPKASLHTKGTSR